MRKKVGSMRRKESTITKVMAHSLLELLVKSKAIPLQAWTDPEGSRRMRLPGFTTLGT